MLATHMHVNSWPIFVYEESFAAAGLPPITAGGSVVGSTSDGAISNFFHALLNKKTGAAGNFRHQIEQAQVMLHSFISIYFSIYISQGWHEKSSPVKTNQFYPV